MQFQRFKLAALRVGLPFESFIGPFMPLILEQNDLRLAASFLVLGLGAGALRLEPVALLYAALPLAVSPAPSLVGSFSPFLTDNDGDFLVLMALSHLLGFDSSGSYLDVTRWRTYVSRAACESG